METAEKDKRIAQDLFEKIPQDDKQNIEQQLETWLKEYDEVKSKLSECTRKLELVEKHTPELRSQEQKARSKASKLRDISQYLKPGESYDGVLTLQLAKKMACGCTSSAKLEIQNN